MTHDPRTIEAGKLAADGPGRPGPRPPLEQAGRPCQPRLGLDFYWLPGPSKLNKKDLGEGDFTRALSGSVAFRVAS
jgi:hypothetical protein